MVGESISGYSQKGKENILGIDMKEIGQTELGRAMEYFIMQMVLNTKAIGKIT